MKPALIVHGGAGLWRDRDDDDAMRGVRQAAAIGWEILKAQGFALDAVEKVTNSMEDYPIFDAGYGSHLNQHGEVEMDALIVDGTKHDFGAVAGVQHVQHPISLARKVMTDTPQCFFAGRGADALAARMGFSIIPNLDFVTPEQMEAFRKRHEATFVAPTSDTVGAVALDAMGNIACATSTGGTLNKPQGRVGDSPVFGAGGYADSRYGGASATGIGEQIMRVLLSRYAVEQLIAGKNAQQAATEAIKYIQAHFDPADAGLILVDQAGNIGAAHCTAKMPIAWVDANGDIQTSMGGGVNGLR